MKSLSLSLNPLPYAYLRVYLLIVNTESDIDV